MFFINEGLFNKTGVISKEKACKSYTIPTEDELKEFHIDEQLKEALKIFKYEVVHPEPGQDKYYFRGWKNYISIKEINKEIFYVRENGYCHFYKIIATIGVDENKLFRTFHDEDKIDENHKSVRHAISRAVERTQNKLDKSSQVRIEYGPYLPKTNYRFCDDNIEHYICINIMCLKR